MPELLRRALPQLLSNHGAAVGVVVRYDSVDLDGEKGKAIEPGFTFRPAADTVFKFSYRVSPNSLGIRSVPGRQGFQDEGFVFSFASYF
jgi:hypothetical protein